MSTNKTIRLELSVEEINLILEALGDQPFKRVFGLIGRVQEQAQSQIKQAGQGEHSQ